MISEKDIAKRLEEGQISFQPLVFEISDRESESGGRRVDAIISVGWAEQREQFAVEFKAQSTPKIIREAMYQIKAAAQDLELRPMIIVPFLSEESLRELERENVSGLDLCGNGIVVVPNRFAVYRTGNSNQFPSSAPIKNIYRRNISMVGRMLLIQPRFDRVREILDEINQRDLLGTWSRRPMSLSTVSKALRGLEEDMIVARKGSAVRLLQAEKLLDKLTENYAQPKTGKLINWKFPMPSGTKALKDVLKKAFSNNIPAIVTGVGSVSRYAVMQAGDQLTIYCPDPEAWLTGLPGTQTDRFPTISIIQVEDASIYFDARPEEGVVWASPLQTYLELMAGDKRDKETAGQVKDLILKRLGRDQL